MTSLNRLFALALIISITVPVVAHAASRKGITKPSRGNYESVADEEATRRNQFSSKPAQLVKNKTFKNIGSPFTFTHPDSWKPDTFKSTVILEPVVDKNSIAANEGSAIVLKVEKIPSKKNYTTRELDGYFMSHVTMAATVQEMDWYVPSFNLISSGSVMFAGNPAREYVYTGENRSIKYQYRLILSSFDQQLYLVFYRARPGVFEKDQPVFDGMLKTLKIQQKKAASSAASSGKSLSSRKRR